MFKRTEAQVLKSICLYLKMKQHFFWRANNTGIWDSAKRIYRTPQFVMKGMPDIFCISPVDSPNIFGQEFPNAPVWFAIEAKSTAGKQSPDQKYFQFQFTRYGGIYLLARGIEDVQKVGL